MLALIVSGIKYVTVFSIVYFCFYIAETKYRVADRNIALNKEHVPGRITMSQSRVSGHLYIFIGILVISIFAGIRSSSVGVDTSGYPVEFMKYGAISRSYSELLRIEPDLMNEYLGALLVFFCSRFTAQPGLLLFFYQFLTVIPVAITAYLLRDKISIRYSIAVYLFWFFNNSLNMMRQSVSCAFILLGTIILLLESKSKIGALISFVIAVLFHRSGFYGTILVLSVYMASKISREKLRILIYGFILFIPKLMTSFVLFLYSNGVFKDPHILYYFDVFFMNRSTNLVGFINPFSLYSITYLVACIVLLLMPSLFRYDFFTKVKISHNKDELVGILTSFNLSGFLIYIVLLLSMRTMYGNRFSIFFDFFYTVSIPLAINGNRARLKGLLLIMILFILWAVWIMRMGWSGSSLYKIG